MLIKHASRVLARAQYRASTQTDLRVCTLCGATGHTAANCRWRTLK